jgi:hypothetical protein
MPRGKLWTSPEPLLGNHRFKEPRIPAKFEWSASTIKESRACWRRLYWHKIMRLTKKAVAGTLILGNLGHDTLAKWYLNKRSSAKAIAKRLTNTKVDEIEKLQSFYDQSEYDKLIIQAETVQGMMAGYAELYNRDRMKWNIDKHHIERWFSIDLTQFIFKGKVDLMNKSVLVEHKFLSSLPHSFVEQLPLDTQLRGSVLGADSLGFKPKEVLFDVCKKCKLRRSKSKNETVEEFTKRVKDAYIEQPDNYFMREKLDFPAGMFKTFIRDVTLRNEEYQWIINRDGVDPLVPEAWEPSDNSCDDYHRPCSYLELCLYGLNRATSTAYTQYNPEDKKKKVRK